MKRMKAGPKKVVSVKEEEVDEPNPRVPILSMLCTVAVLYLQEITETEEFPVDIFSPILNQARSYQPLEHQREAGTVRRP